MALITTQHLSKSFGAEDIFWDISLSIPHKARIGLVGPNGIGKTTLLKILMGVEEATSGEVFKARDLRIGYLPQTTNFSSSRTLWQVCEEAFESLLDLQDQLTKMEADLAANPQDADLLKRYGDLQNLFELRGGYAFETRIRQTLTGLSFPEYEWQRSLEQLSGGQRTRAVLAKLLLEQPDVLFLDEPTNHLDIQAIEWLESAIGELTSAVLIISHDRYFLDQVVNTVWEMLPQLETYRGNYSAYLTQREERYVRQIKEYETQQAFIEKEEDYIRRNIAGQNTRQAQGRRKRLERLLSEARLAAPKTQHHMHFRLNNVSRSGDIVIRTEAVQVGYPDDKKVLVELPDLILQRGECAAVIGPNGAGKTTLLKTLLGVLDPLSGEATLGSKVKIGYFAQAHEDLHPDWDLMKEIQMVSPGMLPAEVRDYLARFLFTEDDVYKKVGTLSGGEQGRLALACLALQGANLLLLDEPTNHLDIPSQEILQNMLKQFDGTILLVSHDRFLIDALASQVWYIYRENTTMDLFRGTYSEYRGWQQDQQNGPTVPAAVQPTSKPALIVEKTRKNTSNRERQRIKKVAELEGKIAKAESELAEVSTAMENAAGDAAAMQDLSEQYVALEENIAWLMKEWEELSEE
ncbi:MAG: ABC-F family ATP-binding cassette domain-containing protein [Anaerolineaceae bacterium]|nr:ABC-F family ATP-binding cassette domain-containing protein [Anaerolineaceae bacterium]